MSVLTFRKDYFSNPREQTTQPCKSSFSDIARQLPQVSVTSIRKDAQLTTSKRRIVDVRTMTAPVPKNYTSLQTDTLAEDYADGTRLVGIQARHSYFMPSTHTKFKPKHMPAKKKKKVSGKKPHEAVLIYAPDESRLERQTNCCHFFQNAIKAVCTKIESTLMPMKNFTR